MANPAIKFFMVLAPFFSVVAACGSCKSNLLSDPRRGPPWWAAGGLCFDICFKDVIFDVGVSCVVPDRIKSDLQGGKVILIFITCRPCQADDVVVDAAGFPFECAEVDSSFCHGVFSFRLPPCGGWWVMLSVFCFCLFRWLRSRICHGSDPLSFCLCFLLHRLRISSTTFFLRMPSGNLQL